MAGRSEIAKDGLEAALKAEHAVEPGGNLRKSWDALLAEARVCTRCELYKYATQTVFGEGPLDAKILFVGEQPGDQEDLAGRPFVGPAGKLFDAALEEAGIDRAQTYVTNAVKHFKFVARGKKRIHSKPDTGEITACRWWIDQERALIRPPLTVALGATAARSLIGELLAGAQRREAAMIETSRSQEPMRRPDKPTSNVQASWEALLKEARACTRCELYKCGTQTVFGEGPLDASILFVGEQPGDQEDLAGRPFVGPAGQLFDAALEEAGIDRSATYVTNAVKHFKFIQRGKRRIHNKPDGGEIDACKWWLDQERGLIRPPVTVALGASAARSLIGKTVTISRAREAPLSLADGSECWVTVHPSFLLRIPERERRAEERDRFIADLKRIKARAAKLAS